MKYRSFIETLEVMRSPLEDRKVTLNRVFSTITYPCNFMLIASMNPCPCGYYGSSLKECSCSADQINKYMNRLSGPLLDRIDIHIEVKAVKYDDLSNTRPSESSKSIKERVNQARTIQRLRYQKEGIYSNSQLTSLLKLPTIIIFSLARVRATYNKRILSLISSLI